MGTTDGVYQYHVWLEGSEKTTMLHRVEIKLDRVPAPYHRRQEGLVDKSIKWTSIDDMAPENEWETLEEK